MGNNNNNENNNNKNNNNNNNMNTNISNGGPGYERFLADGKMCPPDGRLNNGDVKQDVTTDDGVEGCFKACQDTPTCTHFIHWPKLNRCRLFSSCGKEGSRKSVKQPSLTYAMTGGANSNNGNNNNANNINNNVINNNNSNENNNDNNNNENNNDNNDDNNNNFNNDNNNDNN